jgi:hypothetical protein
MGNSRHPVGIDKMHRWCGRIGPRIAGMDNQVSSAASSLSLAPISDSFEYSCCIRPSVKSRSLWERGHNMESAGISGDC